MWFSGRTAPSQGADRGPIPLIRSMYYVYILLLINGDLYKGSSIDLKRRMQEHKQGKVKSTNRKKPTLIYYEAYLLESDARRREGFLKTTEGRRLLKQQLRDVLGVGSPSHPTGRPVE